eukprot:SM010721S14107  [mRNA]  locus=s10721:8:385:- [translate_table: standard]
MSNDDELYYEAMGVIVCAIGARYASYCANVARTILIDASESQRSAYEALLKAHAAAIRALQPGSKLCEAYRAATAEVEKADAKLLPFFTKNAGTGMGIEFRESGLSLNSKNERVVRSGMVFNVALG